MPNNKNFLHKTENKQKNIGGFRLIYFPHGKVDIKEEMEDKKGKKDQGRKRGTYDEKKEEMQKKGKGKDAAVNAAADANEDDKEEEEECHNTERKLSLRITSS